MRPAVSRSAAQDSAIARFGKLTMYTSNGASASRPGATRTAESMRPPCRSMISAASHSKASNAASCPGWIQRLTTRTYRGCVMALPQARKSSLCFLRELGVIVLHDQVGRVVGLAIADDPRALDHALHPPRMDSPHRAFGPVCTPPPPDPVARRKRFKGTVQRILGVRDRATLFAQADKAKGRQVSLTPLLVFCRSVEDYSMILATTPEPTVRPPSRMAKRCFSSSAIGAISDTTSLMLSPGMTISVPAGSSTMPVTSVVRK